MAAVAACVVLAVLTIAWGAWALERLGDWARGSAPARHEDNGR